MSTVLCERQVGGQVLGAARVPSYGVNVAKGSAQPVWYGDPNNPTPFTLANTSTGTANVWVGETNSVGPNNPNNSTEIGPGGYVSYDGSQEVYYATADAANATIQILPGVTSFFLPASLASLGGVSVFNQATAPPIAGTPTNSLWFNSTNNSLYQLIGGVWTQQEFNAAQLLEVGTIVANLIAAGTVVAGIVNGTLITGATVRIKNAFGATTLTINIAAGTVLQYLDTGSATQGYLISSSSLSAITDEFSNAVLAGQVTYANPSAGNYLAVQALSGNVNFLNASAAGGPWNIYSSFEPNNTLGFIAYFDNVGNRYNVGHYENSGDVNQQITSTSATDVTGSFLGGLGATSWHCTWDFFYIGDQAAGAPIVNLTLEGGAVAAFSFVEFWFYTSNSLTTRINSTVATFNTQQTGPTLVTAVSYLRIEAWFTLSTGGNVGMAARLQTAGDTFHVSSVFARAEKRQ